MSPKPFTKAEWIEMMSQTLHGPLPQQTLYRVYATVDGLFNDNRILESQMTEVMRHRKKNKGHFCTEWDFMYIEKGDPEFEACSCFKE